MFSRKFTINSAPHRMLFSYEKMELSAAEIWDSLMVAPQRGRAGPQFRKLETVASRLSHCDHFKPLFPAKWIISELPVIQRESTGTSQLESPVCLLSMRAATECERMTGCV